MPKRIELEKVEVATLDVHDGDLLLVRVPPDWTTEQISGCCKAIEDALIAAEKHTRILAGPTTVEFQVVRKVALSA